MSVLNCIPTIAEAYNVSLENALTSKFSKNFKAEPQKQPMFVLIGGFQGSGKTSLIRRIQEVYGGNVISTDAIRQDLFDLKFIHPSEMSKYVSNISRNLAVTALNLNANIYIDANAHAQRVKETEALIREKFSHYSIVKIFMKTSEEVLMSRLKNRSPQKGYYQGTIEDLQASLEKNHVNSADYDYVVETDYLDEEGVAKSVKDFINLKLKIADQS